MKDIAVLETDITDLSSVEVGVETLMTNLSAEIADLKAGQTDPALLSRIDALATKVEDTKARMAAAIVANTPAAPTVGSEPATPVSDQQPATPPAQPPADQGTAGQP